jgi:hypothetical protein
MLHGGVVENLNRSDLIQIDGSFCDLEFHHCIHSLGAMISMIHNIHACHDGTTRVD